MRRTVIDPREQQFVRAESSSFPQPKTHNRFSTAILIVAALGCLFQAGCVALAFQTQGKDQTQQGQQSQQGQISQVAVSPSNLSFGNVTLGSSMSQDITVTNGGDAPLIVTQYALFGTGYSVSGIIAPFSIPAGKSTTLVAKFSPSAQGNFTGNVSISTAGPSSLSTVALQGAGIVGQLTASPPNVSFGNVFVGGLGSLPVTLTNTGTANVTVSNLAVSGPGFTATGISPGLVLSAGQSATLDVTFIPGSAATVNGSAVIASDAANSPLTIAVSGAGMQAEPHSVSLSWIASTSTVVGYNVYRSTVSGGPYTLITGSPVAATTFTDTTVQAGMTYYYVVTSVDSKGNESSYSNESSATIPTP